MELCCTLQLNLTRFLECFSCLSLEPTGSQLEFHYNELLKVIEDIGRDVKPAYTTSKVSTDKLRKSECVTHSQSLTHTHIHSHTTHILHVYE